MSAAPGAKTLRAGFAGAGFAARFHFDSLAGIPGARPAGVWSARAESRERFAKERSIAAYASLAALLENVDAVHVCLPPALHEAVTVAALKKGVHAIVEKPFTGAFGPAGETGFRGDTAPKEPMREAAMASARRMLEAEAAGKARIFYAENWVFAPVVQKEIEIISKTKAQILRMIAEESHSGSAAPAYGTWRLSGGGSIVGKGAHPLTAVLYLKRIEGMVRTGTPIRPATVTARVHEITRLPGYEDKGHLRTDYTDVEDCSVVHLVFEDGTVADVFSSELVMGGVASWLEVFANNHRTRCNINPVDGLETYNPVDEQFRDVYVVEKIGTKQGWSKPAPDEGWMNGYVQELAEFYRCMAEDRPSFSGGELGYDTVSVIYSAYLSAERKGVEVEVP
ncbi:MAG: oxidoreductase [Spirochaetes bacterium RBG_13_68_11]|nr:MAG: oxidoreductase [Spirochaetes bacterium RBG_13_68_11]